MVRPAQPGNANVMLSAGELDALLAVLVSALADDGSNPFVERPDLRAAAVRAKGKVAKARADGIVAAGPVRR